METMPHHLPILEREHARAWIDGAADAPDWRQGLPLLHGLGVTLRELTEADAVPLAEQLTTDEVTRFISPPPVDAEGFRRFIAWAHRERQAGRYACFAVIPVGETTPVGLFQIRLRHELEGVAEWGFILARAWWGTGVFAAGAECIVDFAFDALRLERLEARAAMANGRGQGALAKIGAVKEAVLRQSFERGGERLDQTLWAILRDEWRARRQQPTARLH